MPVEGVLPLPSETSFVVTLGGTSSKGPPDIFENDDHHGDEDDP